MKFTQTPLNTCHLDRNENLYGPAPKCLEVLRSISAEDLSVYSRDYVRGVKSRLSPRVVLIASPNNPTGNSFPDDALNALTEAFLQEKNILVKFFGEPGFLNHIRITLGTREQNEVLLSAFKEFLEARRNPGASA